jgi:hypothetical protein
VSNNGKPVSQEIEEFYELVALISVERLDAVDKNRDGPVFSGEFQVLETGMFGKFGQAADQIGVFGANFVVEKINVVSVETTTEIVKQTGPQIKIIALSDGQSAQISHAKHRQQRSDFIREARSKLVGFW